jgi:hypothetical protein
MLALLFYAYSTGVRSSRQIERSCRTDLAYMAITATHVPDHDTIARFRAEHEAALKHLFIEVLRLCVQAGLVNLEVIAIDGTKMAANASRKANREAQTVRALVDHLWDQAEAADREPKLFESLESAPTAQDCSPRRAALLAAAAELDTMEAATRTEDAERQTRAQTAAAQGHKLNGVKPKDPHKALERARFDLQAAEQRVANQASQQAARRAQAAAEGRRLHRPPSARSKAERDLERARAALQAAEAAAAEAPPPKGLKVNLTDPQSRVMKGPNGYLQGFNGQAVAVRSQVVVACDVTQDANDVKQLIHMIELAERNAAAAGIKQEVGVSIADAGYWSIENVTQPGPDRLIATREDQRRAVRSGDDRQDRNRPPAEDAPPSEVMEYRLRTPEGAALYALRSHTIEPVFANITWNLQGRRFMRRGLSAGRSEFALMCTVHNLGKLFALRNRADLSLASANHAQQ